MRLGDWITARLRPARQVTVLTRRVQAQEAQIGRLRSTTVELRLLLRQARAEGRDRDRLASQVRYLERELQHARAQLAAREQADQDMGERK